MTFVFSGVGMSRRVAEWIGEIPDSVGFVLPTYGWRVPKLARRLIASRKEDLSRPGAFTWAVFTCGDDTGFIDRDLEGIIGRRLDAAYSVVMPDTYLGLPGFKLDSKEETAAKMKAAESRCVAIRGKLLAHEAGIDMKRGAFAWTKTCVIGRFFNRFIATDRFFRLTPGKCVKCGKCISLCPAGAIEKGPDGTPVWKRDGSCTGCFRCYHVCKGDAIEFGPFTRGKGRLIRDTVP